MAEETVEVFPFEEQPKLEKPKSPSVVIADDSGSAWEAIRSQAIFAHQSGLLPTAIKTPQQAAIIALAGRELNLGIMTSLAEIFVVNGKKVLSSSLMMALAYRGCPGAKITITTPVDTQHLECEAIFQRPGGEPMTFRFTLEDARRAGLLDKQVWKSYPQDMLRARCIARGCRAVFPDCVLGCVVEGEETVEEIHGVSENKAALLADRLKTKQI